jgi:hypothetical protein
MTRTEIEGLDEVPMEHDKDSIFFPLIDLDEAEPDRFKWHPWPGLRAYFDGAGRCCQLRAVFSWDSEPPLFAFRGELLNGMAAERARELLGSLAGVGASGWERGDPIMTAWVEPASR